MNIFPSPDRMYGRVLYTTGGIYMRKRGITVFTLSMMLALGTATLTAYAAGWQQSGTDWVYYDSNNYKVTNEWKKGAEA